MIFLHVFTLPVIDIHQKKFISLFLTPFIGLEILTFSGMVSARQLTICRRYRVAWAAENNAQANLLPEINCFVVKN